MNNSNAKIILLVCLILMVGSIFYENNIKNRENMTNVKNCDCASYPVLDIQLGQEQFKCDSEYHHSSYKGRNYTRPSCQSDTVSPVHDKVLNKIVEKYYQPGFFERYFQTRR